MYCNEILTYTWSICSAVSVFGIYCTQPSKDGNTLQIVYCYLVALSCLAMNQPCREHGDCVSKPNAYTCNCHKGWYFNGMTCLDYDECRAEKFPCGEHAVCQNSEGSYK